MSVRTGGNARAGVGCGFTGNRPMAVVVTVHLRAQRQDRFIRAGQKRDRLRVDGGDLEIGNAPVQFKHLAEIWAGAVEKHKVAFRVTHRAHEGKRINDVRRGGRRAPVRYTAGIKNIPLADDLERGEFRSVAGLGRHGNHRDQQHPNADSCRRSGLKL